MRGDRTVRIHSRMARASYAGTWVLGLAATFGGMFDPATGPDNAEIFPGIVFVSAECLLIIRSLRLGLVIDDELVTSRGLLRTRKFPRGDVTRVSTTGYSGIANKGATSGYLMMLRLRVAGKPVELPNLIGPPNAVRSLSTQAQSALGTLDEPGTGARD